MEYPNHAPLEEPDSNKSTFNFCQLPNLRTFASVISPCQGLRASFFVDSICHQSTLRTLSVLPGPDARPIINTTETVEVSWRTVPICMPTFIRSARTEHGQTPKLNTQSQSLISYVRRTRRIRAVMSSTTCHLRTHSLRVCSLPESSQGSRSWGFSEF